ncbi:MAG: hypothetical protein ACXW1N_04100 [Halobacteriota archaeon]|jgi:hypothetical protein
MTPENSMCFYGVHIGCPGSTNPDCRVCAERLTHVVNQVMRQTASDIELAMTQRRETD